jgi:DNA-binding transcriptional MerR regulator
MYIGQASKKSGATVKAIRLYEELGLLPNIPRENSYRVFSEEDVLIIKFIKIAQAYDFKLSELKDIIYPKGSLTNWENIRNAIFLKEQRITKKVLKLQQNLSELESYRSEINNCLSDHSDCQFPQVQK